MAAPRVGGVTRDAARLLTVLSVSGELESNVHQARLPPGSAAQGATLQHSQHRSIALQDVGNDLSQPGLAADGNEVAHERLPDSLSLTLVRNEECRLSLPRLRYDIATSARDYSSAAFLYGDERDVVDEIDVQEIVGLIFAEAALRCEETPIARLITAAMQSRQHTMPVLGPERTYLDDPPVGEPLDGRICLGLHVVLAAARFPAHPAMREVSRDQCLRVK